MQRGSSRREDLLDVAIKLDHPSEYSAENGAQFVVKFEKARGLFGEDVREIEAALSEEADGRQVWTWKDADKGNQDRVVELLNLGMRDSDIAQELGVNRSTVYRARKRAEAAGLVEARNGKA
jgi:DNA-binding transcriptional ArsR family regulator